MGSTIENKNNSTSQSKAVILEIGQEYEKIAFSPHSDGSPALFLYYTFSLLFFLPSDLAEILNKMLKLCKKQKT